MLSESQIGTLANAVQWLIWSLGGVLLLLTASLFSLDYLMKDAVATNLAEMRAVANDTLSHKELASAIPVADLMASPKKHHNQPVRVKGYLHLEFEGDAIYNHRADYIKNKFELPYCRISFSDSLSGQKPTFRYSDCYVVVSGIFCADDIEQTIISSGSISNISCLNSVQRGLE